MRGLSRQRLGSLISEGFAVVDNAFDEGSAMKMLGEIKMMKERGNMFSNATRLVAVENGVEKRLAVDKKNIWEQEMSDPNVQKLIPNLADVSANLSHKDFLHQLSADMNDVFAEKKIQQEIALDYQAMKIQSNTGGSFPIHTDSDGIVDTRLISAILYLNPDWKKNDGGQLRLYPFPYKQVDVEPVFNRLVIFPSTGLLHRVLPSNAKNRFCCTFWFSGNLRHPTADSPTSRIFSAKLRNIAARLVYAQEWEEAIRESHADSEARDQMIANHWKDISTIGRGLSDYVPYIGQYLPVDRNSAEGQEIKINWF